jgi:glycosyltransferase involved in cell wall biosynthesis
MFVSVIVPCYNHAPYLKQRIESILNQTYQNFELILVNDGSTDGSAAICQRYKIQDPRVKVYHKSKGGVGSSRNRALEAVTGDYILFVDNDDWILVYHYRRR